MLSSPVCQHLATHLVNSQFSSLALFFHNFCTLQTNTLCLTVQVYHQTLPVFLNQNYVSCLVFSWLRDGWLLALAQQLHSQPQGLFKRVFFKYILLVYACISTPVHCANLWLKNLLGFNWKKNFPGVSVHYLIHCPFLPS